MENIQRGTTPYLKVSLGDIEINEIVDLWVSIVQNKKVKIHKTLADLVDKNGEYFIHLSQEETLSLDSKRYAWLQGRVLASDGEAYNTDDKKLLVEDVEEEGVIGGN